MSAHAVLRAGLAGLLLGLAGAAPLQAADDPSPPPPPRGAAPAADPLGEARAHVRAGRWPQALAALRRADLAADADWNNLMGYVLRKGSPPDLDGAQRHYDAALRIQPAHRGALEYAGELALMRNDPARARAYLERLQAACPAGCEELSDLRQALARHGGAPR